MHREEIEEKVRQLGSPEYAVHHGAYCALQAALAEDENAEVMSLVLQGLEHPYPPIRRWCADLMDHYGTDACVSDLSRLLRDPVPKVRRQAVHSLACQRCKQTPLQIDSVPLLADIALNDTNRRVRQEALYGLSLLPSDERAIAALRTLLNQETDPILRKAAHFALCRQDEAYRQETNEGAKARPLSKR